jgi:hypothetical protein
MRAAFIKPSATSPVRSKTPRKRDMSEYNGSLDLRYLQAKISAAGEMKSASKQVTE